MSTSQTQKPDTDTPEVEVREWGSYGTVLVEQDNVGGWIMDKSGCSVEIDSMQ